MTRDPFTLSGGYVMDKAATRKQLELMTKIADGDCVVVAIGGRGYCLEGAGDTVPATMVQALVHRQWLVAPGYPLLVTDHHAGRLTTRGQYALARGS